MNEPITDAYFEWLYSLVGLVARRNKSKTHWELCRELYSTPFMWFVPNDDNRSFDGQALREEFLDSTNKSFPDIEIAYWIDLECSMFEMLIGLSRRASFNATGEPYDWFWTMIDNLGLYGFTDDIFGQSEKIITKTTLSRVNNRTYNKNGKGGIFPLRRPTQDQRNVELWYQMTSYLIESNYVANRQHI